MACRHRRRAGGGWQPESRHRAGAVTAAIVFVVVANGAPILLVAFGWVVRDMRRRRLERSEAARIRAFVPEVADLCSIGLSAGLSIRSAVRHVADIGDNPVCDALGEAVLLSDRGVAFSDALNTSSEGVHQAVGSLFGMLAVAERSGASASAILQRFADHERELQRRSAQESLRKLPVKLLPPIITWTCKQGWSRIIASSEVTADRARRSTHC